MITCKFENGGMASLRHVVVDALVLNDKNQILLVKRASHLICGNMYGLIGGYVERDETTKEAVKREVKEETGYEVKDIKLLRIVDDPDRPKEDRQNIAFVYLAKAVKQTGKKDRESVSLHWFSLNNLPGPNEFAFDHYDNIIFFRQNFDKIHHRSHED